MSEREKFLKRLAAREDDVVTRRVYADWLDEQGEHEEADRQRKWPEAREWLDRFLKERTGAYHVSLQAVIEFGRQVTEEKRHADRVYTHDENLWWALEASAGEEFWRNLSIVAGLPLPANLEKKDFHRWECCAHEIYYWFGKPDSPDTPDPDAEETDAEE